MNAPTILQCVGRFHQFDAGKFAEAGVGVEIQDFSSPVVLDGDFDERLEAYGALLRNFAGPVAVHGACIDLNPGSADPKIRRLTRERYLQSLEIAERLGAAYLVLHSQVNPAIRDDATRARRIERQLPIWGELVERAQASGLTIVVENVYETHYRDIVQLVERIGSSRVKICLDVGHVKVHSALPIGDWIYGCADFLAYVHLHDNDGRLDQHLPPAPAMLEEVFAPLAYHKIAPVVALEYEPKIELCDEVERIRAGAASVSRRDDQP